MFVIRDVFRAKPGKGKELVAKLKKGTAVMPKEGVNARRILSDTVAGYWTIVVETELEKLQTYFDMMGSRPANPEAEEAMKGYTDLVDGGYREILRLE